MFIILGIAFLLMLFAYIDAKQNYDEVVDILEACNQNFDSCSQSFNSVADNAEYAQERWGYWMGMAEGYAEHSNTCWTRLELLCEGCYPE